MKIKEIARLTSLESGDPQKAITSIKYQTVEKLGASASIRTLVLAAVYEYDEPLSVIEVTSHINNTLGLELSEQVAKYHLDSLVKAGDMLMRKERPDERLVRANGKLVTMNKPANMYFRKGIGVPHRTTPILVPGVALRGPGDSLAVRAARQAKAEKTKAKVKGTSPAFLPTQEALGTPRPSADLAALDFMIEKLVSERTAELQKKLDEANAKLAEFKKLLS
jgi:hypothetical protein